MSAVVKLPRAHKALDIPVTFTHFQNLAAQEKSERELPQFRELVDLIEQTQAPTKATLPLLSFARYGDDRTPKGCYRHDANVGMITAISGDHDAGTMALEEAQSRLAKFDIAAVLHTTASHAAGAPRWHVFCPLLLGLMGGSGRRGLDRFRGLVALLNGILGGALKGESFALSQPYYYGHVEGVEYQIAIVDGANTLDSMDTYEGIPNRSTLPPAPASPAPPAPAPPAGSATTPGAVRLGGWRIELKLSSAAHMTISAMRLKPTRSLRHGARKKASGRCCEHGTRYKTRRKSTNSMISIGISRPMASCETVGSTK